MLPQQLCARFIEPIPQSLLTAIDNEVDNHMPQGFGDSFMQPLNDILSMDHLPQPYIFSLVPRLNIFKSLGHKPLLL